MTFFILQHSVTDPTKVGMQNYETAMFRQVEHWRRAFQNESSHGTHAFRIKSLDVHNIAVLSVTDV